MPITEITAKPDLDKDFKASADRVEELKAGRQLGDIGLKDDYWIALKKHRIAHGKV